jgi:hypothetical protein
MLSNGSVNLSSERNSLCSSASWSGVAVVVVVVDRDSHFSVSALIRLLRFYQRCSQTLSGRGWVRASFPPEIRTQQMKNLDCFITESKIIHGLLNTPT